MKLIAFNDGSDITEFVGRKSEFTNAAEFVEACKSEFREKLEELSIEIGVEHVHDEAWCRYYPKMPNDVSYLGLDSGYLFCSKGQGAFEVYFISVRDLVKTKKKDNLDRTQPYAGLSGFLAPDGVFYECTYMKHKELASRLVEDYKVDFYNGHSNDIPCFYKFGCHPSVKKEGDSECHAFGLYEPTQAQIAWLLANLDRMTDVQKLSVLRDLYSCDVDLTGLDI